MADPTWENVVLRLTFDGSDGSTTFTDLSPAGHTVTGHGSAQIDTAQSKWGGSSLYLNGSSKLTIAASSQLTFGTGAWTVACWVRPSVANGEFLFDFRNATYSSERTIMLLGDFGSVDFFDGETLGLYIGNEYAGTGTWQHLAWCYDGTTLRAFLDGVITVEEALSLNHGFIRSLTIGDQYLSGDLTGSAFTGWIDDIIIVKGEALYTAAFTPPSAAYPTSGSVSGQEAFLQAPDVLETTASVLALLDVPPAGQLADSGPLGQPSARAWVDFTGAVDETAPKRYAVTLHTDSGDVRADISSWQSTQQVGQSCYMQCVIPACDDYVDAIGDADSFTIYRIGSLVDGSPIEYAMATSTITEATFTRSPSRNTCTLSGYFDAYEEVEDPDPLFDRTLSVIRLITSSGSGTRVRCAIDWTLRPAQRALFEETSIVVSYINHYANEFDEFMDVGSRNDAGG